MNSAMDNQSLQVLRIIFDAIAVFSLFLAAWLPMRDIFQTPDERERTRMRYREHWEKIQDSGILELPERSITSFLYALRLIVQRFRNMVGGASVVALVSLLTLIPIFAGIGAWIVFGWLTAVLIFIGFIILFAIYAKFKESDCLGRILLFATYILTILCFWMVVRLPVFYAAIVMIFTLPIFAPIFMYFVLTIRHIPFWGKTSIGDETEAELRYSAFYGITGFSVALSFPVTLAALLVGHTAVPNSWIPKTLQMLLSNAIFDGLTMSATIIILSRCLQPKRLFPIPVAIILDIVLALVFACCSLWFGLCFTQNALSWNQILNVLVAKSLDGTKYELGTFFWAMHTVFLPTLAYLSVLLILWMAKLIVLPVSKILSRGKELDHPHHLTATLFGIIAAVFIALEKFLALFITVTSA